MKLIMNHQLSYISEHAESRLLGGKRVYGGLRQGEVNPLISCAYCPRRSLVKTRRGFNLCRHGSKWQLHIFGKDELSGPNALLAP